MGDRTVDLKIRLIIDHKGAVTGIKTTKGETVKFGDAAEGASKQVKKMETGVHGVARAAKALVGAYIGIRGLGIAKEFIIQAATARDVRSAYENLAKSSGQSADEMLKQMKRATAGTISDFQLMQKYSSASLLGLPLDRFDEMLAVARGASKATGESMEFMLNSVVTALGRGSKLMLDNLGILIDVEKANEKYADSLNKTAGELTDAERKQAFINEALAIGTDNLERMGPITDSQSDSFVRLKATGFNIALMFFDNFVPAAGALADTLERIISVPVSETLRDEQGEFNALVKILKDANTQQDTRNKAIKELQDKYGAYIGNLNLESASIEDIAAAQKLANEEFEKRIRLQAAEEILAEAARDLANAQKDLFESTKELNELEGKRSEGIRAGVNIWGGIIQQIARAKSAQDDDAEAVQELTNEYQELYDALVEQGLITQETTEATEEQTGANVSYREALLLIPPALKFVEETEVQAAERAREVFEYRLAIVQGYMDAFKGVFQGLYDWRKQIIQNELNAEIKAQQSSFAASKKIIEAKYTVEGKLTEEGLKKLGELEEGHVNTVTRLKEQARQEELKAKKAMVPVLVAEAIINTALGATKVLPNIYKFLAVLALGGLQVAKIVAEGANITGAYAKGGQFSVPGTGGPDSQTVIIRATPREEFFAVPPGGWKPLPMPGGGGLASSAHLERLAQAVERNTRAIARKRERPVLEARLPSMYRLVVDSLGPELQKGIKRGEITLELKG